MCLGYGLWRFLALALSAARAAFRADPPGGTDRRIVPYTGPEPARPAYRAGQMWRDAGFAGRDAALTVRYLLTRHWLGEVVRRLLRGRNGWKLRRRAARGPSYGRGEPARPGRGADTQTARAGGGARLSIRTQAPGAPGLSSWGHVHRAV
ncbi:hypothetical protein OG444_29365 [Streptomyces sp. NBC_01232]|uniref:hypothetical protein n=1 Tax=Streptomyces sp. NBC_01232 TaxID=2903786 RepID=UPI002E0E078C|nr:hypothetical protein OG444_29365 [Streptomyces sp. NBC_01232]